MRITSVVALIASLLVFPAHAQSAKWWQDGRDMGTVLNKEVTVPVGGSSKTIKSNTEGTNTLLNQSSASQPPVIVRGSLSSVTGTDFLVQVSNGTTAILTGGTVTYTITVQNVGTTTGAGSVTWQGEGSGATVTLANGVCGSISGAGSCLMGAGTGTISLDPGASLSITVTGAVGTTEGAYSFTGRAVATGATVDVNTENNIGTDSDPVVSNVVDLSVGLTPNDGNAFITLGGSKSYRAVVTNPVNKLVLANVVTGISSGTGSTGSAICSPALCIGGSCTPTATGAALTIGAGGSCAFDFTTLPSGGVGNITTEVTAVAGGGMTDGNTANNSASHSATITKYQQDWAVAITDPASGASIAPGNTRSYVLWITSPQNSYGPITATVPVTFVNSGGATASIQSTFCAGVATGTAGGTINMPFPAGKYPPASAGGVAYSCTIVVNSGGSAVGSYSLSAGPITHNRTADTEDGNATNNSASVGASLQAQYVDVSLNWVTAMTATMATGSKNSGVFRIANAGPNTATGILTVSANAVLDMVATTDATIFGSPLAGTTKTRTYSYSLSSGTSANVSILPTANAAGTGTMTITAGVDTLYTDSNTANNTLTGSTTISTGAPLLGVTINRSVATAYVGNSVYFDAVIANSGSATATASLAQIGTPAGTITWSPVSNPALVSATGGATCTWPNCTIPAGASVTYRNSVTVAGSAGAGSSGSLSYRMTASYNSTSATNINSIAVNALTADPRIYLSGSSWPSRFTRNKGYVFQVRIDNPTSPTGTSGGLLNLPSVVGSGGGNGSSGGILGCSTYSGATWNAATRRYSLATNSSYLICRMSILTNSGLGSNTVTFSITPDPVPTGLPGNNTSNDSVSSGIRVTNGAMFFGDIDLSGTFAGSLYPITNLKDWFFYNKYIYCVSGLPAYSSTWCNAFMTMNGSQQLGFYSTDAYAYGGIGQSNTQGLHINSGNGWWGQITANSGNWTTWGGYSFSGSSTPGLVCDITAVTSYNSVNSVFVSGDRRYIVAECY